MDNSISDLFDKMRKSDRIPNPVKAALLLFSSFLFQGIFYVSRTERYFKIATELLLGFGIFTLYRRRNKVGRSLAISFGLAHLLNWLLNAHQMAVFHTVGYISNQQSEFESWMDYIAALSRGNSGIQASYVVGRPARGSLEFSETSDLDVRLVRSKGILNALRANLCLVRLRTLALVKRFPLDIYLLDSEAELAHLRDDESPIELSPERRETKSA